MSKLHSQLTVNEAVDGIMGNLCVGLKGREQLTGRGRAGKYICLSPRK